MSNQTNEKIYLKTVYDVGKEFLNLKTVYDFKGKTSADIGKDFVYAFEETNYIHVRFEANGSIFVGWNPPYQSDTGRNLKITKRTVTYTENYASALYGRRRRILHREKNTPRLEKIAKIVQDNWDAIADHLSDNLKSIYIDNTEIKEKGLTYEQFEKDYYQWQNELDKLHGRKS